MGLLLYGSVARGDATAHSDIDLLVVGNDDRITVKELRQAITPSLNGTRVSLVYHTVESLTEYFAAGGRFLVHLRREGIVLFDRNDLLDHLLTDPWEPISAAEEIGVELQRLATYRHVSRFGGELLFPLAHVFTIGKAIVMAELAEAGVYEFNRDRAFEQFAGRHPELDDEVRIIRSLAPFRALTHREADNSLPFDPSSPTAEHRLLEAVEAVQRIASAE